MTDVRTFPDSAALGDALAAEIVEGIDAARRDGRRYILGCPGGRSPRTTYLALARRLAGADVSHLVIAMMDDYVMTSPSGGWQHVPDDAHYSCRKFAFDEIAAPIDSAASRGVSAEHIWLPDPADPDAYDDKLTDAGGVDLFVLASGASDGHIAFNKPGTPADSRSWIVPLADATRRDNMATFPDFERLDQVPTHGVSVGLGTITEVSRSVRLVIHGTGKREAARRVIAADDLEIDWPATIVHRCRDARILVDEAAHPDSARRDLRQHEEPQHEGQQEGSGR